MPSQPWDKRVEDQVEEIRREFRAQPYPIEIKVHREGAGVGFMYAGDEILVRDEYLGHVRQTLGQGPDVVPLQRVVKGVVRHPLTGMIFETSEEALSAIETQHGRGIATPNHVLTVAGVGGPCPATEPEQVYDGSEPYPAIQQSGGAGVLVYVADTGLVQGADSACPWLQGVARATDRHTGNPQPWDMEVPQPGSPSAPGGADGEKPQEIPPYVGHGTFVAGVVRAMAPQADVIVSNIFKVAGSALESDFVRELDDALGLGVDIFNLSVTAPTMNDRPLLAFGRWLERASEIKGVVCVAAAGNSGQRIPSWPAACPDVVSVGALAGDWRSRAEFSNHGGWVDVYAPGRNIVNAFASGVYTCKDAPYEGHVRHFYGMAKWSGTSFSTPMVTGLIAARMSRTGENGRAAAAALLAEAREQAIPGTGAILRPYDNVGAP